jgi:hypothetical protein
MYLADGGNVGISTTSPTNQLTIGTTTDAGTGVPTGIVKLQGAGASGTLTNAQVGSINGPAMYHKSNFGGALSSDRAWSFEVNRALTATAAMIITDTGKVGISIATPYALLHANQVATTDGTGWDNLKGLRVGGYYDGSSATGVHLQIGANQTGHSYIQSFEDTNVAGTQGTHENLALQPGGGNVGIGTTNPESYIHARAAFNSGNDCGLYLQGGDDGNSKYGSYIKTLGSSGYSQTAIGKLTASGGAAFTQTEYIRITDTGNVGIGTETPSEKLDVAGNMILTGSIKNPTLYSYRETLVTASTGASYEVDCSTANNFQLTLGASLSTLTFSNVPSGVTFGINLYLKQGGTGSYTVTWPASVGWGDAGAPVLTTTVGKTDIVNLITIDGGTSWYGFLAGKNF